MPGYYLDEKLVKLYNKYKGICSLCDLFIPIQEATIEHNIPKLHGGTDGMHNLSVAHSSCNNARGSDDVEVFRARARGSIAHKSRKTGVLERELVTPEIHLVKLPPKLPNIKAVNRLKFRCIYCGSAQIDMGERKINLGKIIRIVKHCFNCSQDNFIRMERVKDA
jgi:hypothetical protein